MKWLLLILTVLSSLRCPSAGAENPTTLPTTAPSGLDAGTWQRMRAIDALAGSIATLTADYQQKKFTPLLKKPMASSGRLTAKGPTMLWDTRSDPSTIMRIDDREIQLYYPGEKIVEIYPMAGQLASVVSSPIPRLASLVGHFTFAPIAAKSAGAPDEAGFLALRMTPIDETMKQHVDNVTVLLDAERGVIVNFIVIDADGDRTEIQFSNIRINPDVDDSQMQIKLPPGVKVVHPVGKVPQ